MLEHRYSFDDDDVAKYTEKIHAKYEGKVGQKEAQQRAQRELAGEDIDFINEEDVEGAADLDMENLNLFGVPLSDLDLKDLGGKQESVKEQNQRRKFVRELIDVMEVIDAE